MLRLRLVEKTAMQVFTAKCLLPVSGPPLREGAAVAVDGETIVAVGPVKDVVAAAGENPVTHDLGDAVLMPGLVNAHTHLELSWLADDRPPEGDFLAWLKGLLERREDEDAERVAVAAREALAFLESRGTVVIGEVTNGVATIDAVARSGLHGTVFLELYRLRSSEAEEVMERAAEQLAEMERIRDEAGARDRLEIVLSPHAAHTTSGPLLKALAGRASATGSLLSIHVAESAAELAMVDSGTGPLPEFYRERGFWDETWSPTGHSPVALLDRLGVLSQKTLAIHCVQLSRQDLSRLQSRGVTAVVCPRSNAYLGVGTSPVPKILSSGVPVALGTDSLASAPDLDLFAEMAALRDDHPGLAPAAVLRMATLNGARALGFAKRFGSLEPGKAAAIVGVPLAAPGDDPLETVTSNPEQVTLLGKLSAPSGGDGT
jgi:cytosine/adenosine deaminase-related metal-dependent hydrolase